MGVGCQPQGANGEERSSPAMVFVYEALVFLCLNSFTALIFTMGMKLLLQTRTAAAAAASV